MGEKQWIYISVSAEQVDQLDKIIEHAKGRGIHRSRAELVAEAIADYIEKPEIQKKISPGR